MNEEQLKALRKALGLPDTATVAEVMAAVEAMVADKAKAADGEAAVAALSSMRTTLGLPATATGETIAAATAALKAGAGNPDPAKYVPVAAVTELQGQIAALSARVNGGELDSLVQTAMSDGRLLPALEPWARELGGKDIGQLKSYLDKAPKIAALSSLQGGQPPADDKTGLSAEQLAVCTAMGVKPEDFLANLKE